MIEVTNLTKRYGHTTAVSNLSFTVQPGIVTGFLGPNGAGKSTTMRMILGLGRHWTGRTARRDPCGRGGRRAALTEGHPGPARPVL